MSEVAAKHKEHAPKSLSVSILTCSTSKFREQRRGRRVEDPSGDIIERLMKDAGHRIAWRKLISDDDEAIRRSVRTALRSREPDALIITGGTGLSPTDLTVETVRDLIEKDMPGFGEIFRRISYDRIGSPAIMTRAMAGVAKGKVIFCLPGSPDAVETALSSLIIPEIGHAVKIARQR